MQGRSGSKTDTNPAATFLPRRNVATETVPDKFRLARFCANGRRSTGWNGPGSGNLLVFRHTRRTQISDALSTNRTTPGQPALVALIERISGHEPTGKGEVPSYPTYKRQSAGVQGALLESSGLAA